MFGVGGVTHNAECVAGQAGVVDILKGGEGINNDLTGCSHYVLQSFSAGCSATSIPHGDAAGQNAVSGGSVEGVHNGDLGFGSSQHVAKIEALLSFLGQ